MEHLVLYAAASGTTADDGVGSGGRFTTELVSALGLRGVTVQDAFERARSQVWSQTEGRQRPEMVVSAGAVVFRYVTDEPSTPAAAVSARPSSEVDAENQLLSSLRKLLSEEITVRSALSDDDAQTARDIDHVLHLLFPPLESSKKHYDRLVEQGVPWAALVLAQTLRNGYFGPIDLERSRAMTNQLRRSGMESRLSEMHRGGSRPATVALALLKMTIADRGDEFASREILSLLRGPASALYEPAMHLYLQEISARDYWDEVAMAIEQNFRNRVAAGDQGAQFTLNIAALNQIIVRLRKGTEPDPAAARVAIVALLKPARDQGLPWGIEATIRAYSDDKLGPPDLSIVDELCDQARRVPVPTAMRVCAETWTGEHLPRRDPTRALAWMREAADLGDAAAGNAAGIWIQTGFGTAPDPATAFLYLSKCAQQGSIHCMVNAASALHLGRGTKRDARAAADLYRAAALLGNNWAGTLLAQALLYDPDLDGSSKEIKRWLLDGLNHDYSLAWVTLADLLRTGRVGIPQEPTSARFLYKKAALKGDPTASARYCEMLIYGEGGPEDSEVGIPCLERLAESGDIQSLLILGDIYRSGRRVPIDERRAYRYYEAASERGQPAALAMMGQFHEFALGGYPVDQQLARRFYEQAADKGSVDGLAFLGSLLVDHGATVAERRSGLAKLEDAARTGNPSALWLLARELLTEQASVDDRDRGIALLQAASDAGSIQAQFALAQRLIFGQSVAQNVLRGRLMLENLASKYEYVAAMNQLAQLSETGVGSDTPDVASAARWYRLAATKGDGSALVKLGQFAMRGLGEPVDAGKALALYQQSSDSGYSMGT